MCGARKFSLEYLTRNDIACLTRDAAEVTGIKYIMDIDAEEAEQILMGKEKIKSKGTTKPKSKISPKLKVKGKVKGKTKK